MNIVILAAGQGKRMRSALPKVLHRLAGRPLLGHVLATARALGAGRICVVYGHGGEVVREALDAPDLAWVKQDPQHGTGHAMRLAAPHLDESQPTLVLYGDVPLTRAQTLQALIDAAKKEGQVVWYTTQIVNQFVVPAAAAFEKKYGIKVNYLRNDSQDIMLRVQAEHRAGGILADVYDGVTGVSTYKRDGFLHQWQPDIVKNLPKDYYDKEGFWTGVSLYISAFSYNTDLVKKEEAPRTYEDLLAIARRERRGGPLGAQPRAP